MPKRSWQYGLRSPVGWVEMMIGEDVLELFEGDQIIESDQIDVELLLQVLAHLSFHLADSPKLEHALGDDGPGLVGELIHSVAGPLH